jgi:uncharacterized protein
MTVLTEPFRKAHAVSLTTFRKDGSPVATAIWFYVEGDRLFTTTHASAAKLKRLARNSSVEIAVCTQSGKVKGPVYTGTARVMSSVETVDVMKKKQRRYPVHRLMMPLPSMREQIGLEITPGSKKSERGSNV